MGRCTDKVPLYFYDGSSRENCRKRSWTEGIIKQGTRKRLLDLQLFEFQLEKFGFILSAIPRKEL